MLYKVILLVVLVPTTLFGMEKTLVSFEDAGFGKILDTHDDKLINESFLELTKMHLIEAFLANGVDINTVDVDGQTLLHVLVQRLIREPHNELLKAIHYLLKKGINIELRDVGGRMACHWDSVFQEQEFTQKIVLDPRERSYMREHIVPPFPSLDYDRVLIEDLMCDQEVLDRTLKLVRNIKRCRIHGVKDPINPLLLIGSKGSGRKLFSHMLAHELAARIIVRGQQDIKTFFAQVRKMQEESDALCIMVIGRVAALSPEDLSELQHWLKTDSEGPHSRSSSLLILFSDSTQELSFDLKKYFNNSIIRLDLPHRVTRRTIIQRCLRPHPWLVMEEPLIDIFARATKGCSTKQLVFALKDMLGTIMSKDDVGKVTGAHVAKALEAMLRVRKMDTLQRMHFLTIPYLSPLAILKGVDTTINKLKEVLHIVENLDQRAFRSLLLYGPPGTGKTTLAYGLADACGWGLMSYSMKEFCTLLEGQSSFIMDEIRSEAPCIVHLFELDVLKNEDRDKDARDTMLPTIMKWISGIKNSTFPCVLIMEGDYFNARENELFNELNMRILLDVPDEAGRQAILHYYFSLVSCEQDVTDESYLALLAKKTTRFSGLFLKRLISDAGDRAIREEGLKAIIKRKHVEEALDHCYKTVIQAYEAWERKREVPKSTVALENRWYSFLAGFPRVYEDV